MASAMTRGKARSAENGFTLLELMVVMALLAFLVGLVMPSLMGSWERAGARASIRKLISTLRLARSEAATQSRRVRLFLNMKTGGYSLENGRQQGELTGLRLVKARLVWEDRDETRGYVAFYGDGSSSGGQVIMEEPSGQRHVVEIRTITGKIDISAQGN